MCKWSDEKIYEWANQRVQEPWGSPQEEVYNDESVIASDTEGARWQVGLKPVEDRATDTEPRWKASEYEWTNQRLEAMLW